ncbi:MAG: thiamine pyrophosphate-dependent dehydrogenase E1 component subunit alpha [Elusimicrobiota bacterium]
MSEYKDIPADVLKSLLSTMLKIRRFEIKLIELYPAQDMRTPIHLCIGQEAIAAGVSANLKKKDYLFTTHRGHGHCIAKGVDMSSMIAEFYGRADGCAHGRGGSMHLVSPECGILGSSAIVGAGLPLAAGCALASKLKNEDTVSVTFFGDGAVDNGAFHESLNISSLKKLPVVFICENNFYATHSHQMKRQPADNIYQRAECYGIPGIREDGTDIIAVYKSSREAIERARSGGGPTLLEYRAYRWKAHVGPNTDYKMGYRTKEELKQWTARCPVRRFEKELLDAKIISHEELNKMIKEIELSIEEAVNKGKQSPWPQDVEIESNVY